MTHNLLTEELITAQTAGGRISLSLPGLLAAMARGEVQSFPGMRPHQRPAWHMFLVQLGTLALWHSKLDNPPEDADTWLKALRKLTSDFKDDAPWHLVPEDPAKPGFLQPPDPGGLKWTTVETPDALDMLVTARNHDIKQQVARISAPEDWMCALVSLQTMEGYNGSGNYGIARMNGGSSSRTMLGFAPARINPQGVDESAWWAIDVCRLLNHREIGGDKSSPCTIEKIALLWLESWPENGSSIHVNSLDPLFVEVCRRVRLSALGGYITAMCATSKRARIDAKEFNGLLGDPWAPINVEEGKALTLGDSDFDYRRIADLLYSNVKKWEVPFLAKQSPDVDGDLVLVAESFSRGNSKTYGFKSRLILIPKPVRQHVFSTRAKDIAKDQIKDIKEAGDIVRNALVLLASKGDWGNKKKDTYNHAKPASKAFERDVDDFFFQHLWVRVEANDKGKDERSKADRDFLLQVGCAAKKAFEDALPSIPCPSLWRPKAEAKARRQFYGAMYNKEFLIREVHDDAA